MIEIKGEISFSGTFNTVNDIRSFLNTLEKYGIKDDAPLLDGYASLIYNNDVELIECGEHYPDEGRIYDLLIPTHTHEMSENQETESDK